MKKEILKPRKTGEQRRRNYKVSIGKRIKRYIKNGSKSSLHLENTPLSKNYQVSYFVFILLKTK